MPQSDERFRAALDAARQWEKALAGWVRAKGWHVLPTYDFSGKGDDKAPKLLAPPGQVDLVMPDLQCFRSGACRWIECKWKTQATWHRVTKRWVTGISLRLANHYIKVQQLTGADVSLLFLHEREGEVRGGPMREIEPLWAHDYGGGRMGRHGMRFWRWEEMPLRATLAEVAAHAPRAA